MRWFIALVLICGGCSDKNKDAEMPAATSEVAAPKPPISEEPASPGAPLAATSAGDALSQTLAACKAQEEMKLWQLMAIPFREELSALAERMASVLSPAEFAEANAFQEPIETLDVMTYLRVVLRADQEHQNPCWKAATWKELAREEGPALLAVLYELPNGHGRGVLVEKSDAGWLLAKITKSLKPEQYATIVPNYQP
jgi:hypothetical protein